MWIERQRYIQYPQGRGRESGIRKAWSRKSWYSCLVKKRGKGSPRLERGHWRMTRFVNLTIKARVDRLARVD